MERTEESATSVILESDLLEPREGWFRSWFPYLRWVPSTPERLQQAEHTFFEYIKTPSEGFYVNVGEINGHSCNIWTRKFTSRKTKTTTRISPPLVMMHGMGAGLAMFAMNFDVLVEESDLYAIDLPGFGRSSRPDFSSDPVEAEAQYVASLDQWRRALNLDKINLLGHSFGGFLTCSYSLKYPETLGSAILVDPWGMGERPDQKELQKKFNPPFWLRAIFGLTKHVNPLVGFRVSGPYGPRLLQRIRPDLMRKYQDIIDEEKLHLVGDYLFHCNAHHPSGESAFHSMMTGMAWAKNPMIPRLKERDQRVPMTVLYGSRSWVTTITEEEFQEAGIENVEVNVVDDAGHHVYADQSQAFNTFVAEWIRKQPQSE